MISHSVECCTDDLVALKERLDELAREGARIVAVIWQPQAVDADQAAAVAGRGSFVIVSEAAFEDPLRAKAPATGDKDILTELAVIS